MIKKTNTDKDLLISYVRFGEGKVSTVDKRFNIDKDYKASISMNLSTEVDSYQEQTTQVELKDEEREIVDAFVKNKLSPLKKRVPYFNGTMEPYETRYILFDGMRIEDEEICGLFDNVVDFVESQHEELATTRVSKMYNDMCSSITRK